METDQSLEALSALILVCQCIKLLSMQEWSLFRRCLLGSGQCMNLYLVHEPLVPTQLFVPHTYSVPRCQVVLSVPSCTYQLFVPGSHTGGDAVGEPGVFGHAGIHYATRSATPCSRSQSWYKSRCFLVHFGADGRTMLTYDAPVLLTMHLSRIMRHTFRSGR